MTTIESKQVIHYLKNSDRVKKSSLDKVAFCCGYFRDEPEGKIFDYLLTELKEEFLFNKLKT